MKGAGGTRAVDSTAPRPARALRIGLTGGIGSGKSTVAEHFAALGVSVVDADEAARAVVAPGTPGLAALLDAFGEGILDREGHLDRRRMRARVFSNPGERRRLEAIVHPLIRTEMDRRLAVAGGVYVLLVVPLLLEGRGRGRVDRVLVVDVPEPVQLARASARDGSPPDVVRRMMETQLSRTERLAGADDVIDNSGPPEALVPQVQALHRRYRMLAGSQAPA